MFISIASGVAAIVVASALGWTYSYASSSAHPKENAEFSRGQIQPVLTNWRALHQRQANDTCSGCDHDARVIQRWSMKHFPMSYAGIYFESGKSVRLVVGYMTRQADRVRTAKRLPNLIQPTRISAFPYVPSHSLRDLNGLMKRIFKEVMQADVYAGLIVGLGVMVETNQVDVGTQRVMKTKTLLKKLYGPQAPISVQYEEPPVELGEQRAPFR